MASPSDVLPKSVSITQEVKKSKNFQSYHRFVYCLQCPHSFQGSKKNVLITLGVHVVLHLCVHLVLDLVQKHQESINYYIFGTFITDWLKKRCSIDVTTNLISFSPVFINVSRLIPSLIVAGWCAALYKCLCIVD